MASFNIHLAIGKRYIQKNKIKDEKSFLNGIIEPDLSDNDKSHYTDVTRDKELLIQYLQRKVILSSFLSENDISTDYKKGIFLHLITDYIFFNDFFSIDYLNSISYNDFCNDLYYSYDYTNEYLQEKYDIDLSEFKTQIEICIRKDREEKEANSNYKAKNVLNKMELDDFIERVSDINLEEYSKKILERNENIFP